MIEIADESMLIPLSTVSSAPRNEPEQGSAILQAIILAMLKRKRVCETSIFAWQRARTPVFQFAVLKDSAL